jgi:hypothetical protein
MRSQLYSTVTRHKRTLAALLFGVAFSAVVAYATPPGSPYTAGETLDPACAPGDINCSVLIIPDQTGNSGEYLTTNGTTLSWATVSGGGSLTGSTSGGGSETWLGVGAGSGGASTTNTVFMGVNAGTGATNSSGSVFIGGVAGANAVNSGSSVFVGYLAGGASVSASNAVFIGYSAGYSATNGSGSTFLGSLAGSEAENAANSIFIGNTAGLNDTVDNTVSGTSILIGNGSSTGGFKNSIAIGTNATNTAQNQLLIASAYTQLNIRGVNYTFPSAQGSASTVLTNNGSGTLSWTAVPSVLLRTDGVTNGSQSILNLVSGTNVTLTDNGSGAVTIAAAGGSSLLGSTSSSNTETWLGSGAGATSSSTNATVFLGLNAGSNSTGATGSVFVGSSSGQDSNAVGASFLGQNSGSGATSADNGVFIGYESGLNASNAAGSVFLGAQTGSGATNAIQSIFIGNRAGESDTVDNTSNISDYSILIGNLTSTGGFSNSIALGSNVVNTQSNQFMIGSSTSPIDSTRINGSASTQCTITTGTGINCTSDERLKTNITSLDDDTLNKIRNVDTVTFNWLATPNTNQQIGFIAQNLEQYFPQLVATDSDGYKGVYYAQMTPILVKAIQELDVKVDALAGIDGGGNFMDSIAAWLANAGNRITRIFTGEICLTDESGDSECLNKEELGRLKQLLNDINESTEPVDEDEVVDAPEEVTQETPEEIPTETPVEEAVVEPEAEVAG